MKRLTY